MPNPDAKEPRLCRVSKRSTWHIYYQRKRISTGCEDRVSAELVLHKFKEGLLKPEIRAAGISGILDAYHADRVNNEKPGAERIGWSLKQLKVFFGDKPPEIITPDSCKKYTAFRLDQGVKISTARTELETLRAAMRWAVREEIVSRAPRTKLPPRPDARQRWLTRDEARELVGCCVAEHIRLFVLLALHTAARKSHILTLTWSRVDLQARIIDFRDPAKARTKKGRARVPINDTLYEALKKAYELRETEFVVEWAGDQVSSVKTGFRAAAKRADLIGITPHTLRHTAATWMAQAGISLWDIAGYLGHSNIKMVEETYAHHCPDYLRTAAGVLG